MAIPASRGQRVVFALLGGIALSLFKLSLHCRAPSSVACVTEKHYYFALLPAEVVIYGAAIFLILSLMKAPPAS